MRYLDKVMFGDEEILYEADEHWVIFLGPLLLVPVFGIGIPFLIAAFVHRATTDLAFTNKRVIGKWGLVSRHTIEQRLEKIEGVQVRQGILGRMLDYGAIVITGTGGSLTPIENIADPLSFRRAVNEAIDKMRASGGTKH